MSLLCDSDSDVFFARQRIGFSSILSEVFLSRQRLGFWTWSLLSDVFLTSQRRLAGGCGFWTCDWTWFCFSPSSLCECQLGCSWIQQSCYVAATLNRPCQQVTHWVLFHHLQDSSESEQAGQSD